MAEAITKLIDAAIAEANVISMSEDSQGRLRNIGRRDDLMDVDSDELIVDLPQPIRLRRGRPNSTRLRSNQRMKMGAAASLECYQRKEVYHILRHLYTEKDGRPQIQWMEKMQRLYTSVFT
nr:hypothetical transcript [Hymenolepis microstoma]